MILRMECKFDYSLENLRIFHYFCRKSFLASSKKLKNKILQNTKRKTKFYRKIFPDGFFFYVICRMLHIIYDSESYLSLGVWNLNLF